MEDESVGNVAAGEAEKMDVVGVREGDTLPYCKLMLESVCVELRQVNSEGLTVAIFDISVAEQGLVWDPDWLAPL